MKISALFQFHPHDSHGYRAEAINNQMIQFNLVP